MKGSSGSHSGEGSRPRKPKNVDRQIIKALGADFDEDRFGEEFKISFPLTEEQLPSIVCSLKNQMLLEKSSHLELLKQSLAFFSRINNIQKICLKKHEKIFIVGDLHGQFYDMLEIFRQSGFPSTDNKYVFNGDLVDRGLWSCEILILLMCTMLIRPKSVFINRGNHECEATSSEYGFLKELEYKYSTDYIDGYLRVFYTLPLGTLLSLPRHQVRVGFVMDYLKDRRMSFVYDKNNNPIQATTVHKQVSKSCLLAKKHDREEYLGIRGERKGSSSLREEEEEEEEGRRSKGREANDGEDDIGHHSSHRRRHSDHDHHHHRHRPTESDSEERDSSSGDDSGDRKKHEHRTKDKGHHHKHTDKGVENDVGDGDDDDDDDELAQQIIDVNTRGERESGESDQSGKSMTANSPIKIGPRIIIFHGGIPLPLYVEPGKLSDKHGHQHREPGGSKAITLKNINDLKRYVEPSEGTDQIITQILWSDPMDENGTSPSNRSFSQLFGPDITKQFMEANRLSYFIRSHEVVDGHLVHKSHQGRVITLFSAPDATDEGNTGEYVQFDGDKIVLFPDKWMYHEIRHSKKPKPLWSGHSKSCSVM